ncbi:MAG: hypothetical protein K2M10_01955 [Muribaculaceae bacterium]|nr:hypothetical protein [Muribaculaceae bacterium]
MKKNLFGNLLAGGVCLLATGLMVSCESGVGENYTTSPFPALNVVFPLDGATPAVGWQTYSLKMDYVATTETVTGGFIINNNSYALTTDPVKYKNYYENGVVGVYGAGFSGSINNSLSLSDAAFFMTGMPIPQGVTYDPTKSWIPKVKKEGSEILSYHPGAIYTPNLTTSFPLLIGKYKAGNQFSVMTCFTDMSFFGTTKTSYPAGPTYPAGEFSNPQMIYRVLFDIKAMKADVVIYNARFAESAPSIDVIYLPSLDLKFENEGYTIEGTSVVPQIPEGNGSAEILVPNTRYTFDSFKLVTKPGTVLSEVEISYQVATVFNGSFEGHYTVLPSEMKNN